MFNKAKTLASLFKNHGFECLLVGGAVRDTLLGSIPNDIDLVTNASIEEQTLLFQNSSYSIIPTGVKHGTLTVLVEKTPIEVTQYRGLSFQEDSKTRDFKMNAIYYDFEKDQYYDPQQGRDDLSKKIISFVGEAKERIQEDPLRALRAFRFLSTLGFSLDEKSLQAAKEALDQVLMKSSVERIRVELLKMMAGNFFNRILENHPYVLLTFFPEIQIEDLSSSNPLLRLASLGVSQSSLEKFKFSTKEIRYVSFLVQNQDQILDEKKARRLFYLAQKLFSHEARAVLQDLSLLSSSGDVLLRELELTDLCFESPLTGDEIKDIFGLTEGEKIGRIKDFLVEEILAGNLKSSDKEKARELLYKKKERNDSSLF